MKPGFQGFQLTIVSHILCAVFQLSYTESYYQGVEAGFQQFEVTTGDQKATVAQVDMGIVQLELLLGIDFHIY